MGAGVSDHHGLLRGPSNFALCCGDHLALDGEFQQGDGGLFQAVDEGLGWLGCVPKLWALWKCGEGAARVGYPRAARRAVARDPLEVPR